MSVSEQVMTLDELKPILEAKLKKNESVVGLKFQNSKGSVGTIIDGLGPHNKLQASMTCTLGGPDHVRERSDWHQCSVSPEKSKTHKAASKPKLSDEEKAAKAAERKAAQEAKKAEKKAAKDAERAQVLKTSTEKLKEYAASVGVTTK